MRTDATRLHRRRAASAPLQPRDRAAHRDVLVGRSGAPRLERRRTIARGIRSLRPRARGLDRYVARGEEPDRSTFARATRLPAPGVELPPRGAALMAIQIFNSLAE